MDLVNFINTFLNNKKNKKLTFFYSTTCILDRLGYLSCQQT